MFIMLFSTKCKVEQRESVAVFCITVVSSVFGCQLKYRRPEGYLHINNFPKVLLLVLMELVP